MYTKFYNYIILFSLILLFMPGFCFVIGDLFYPIFVLILPIIFIMFFILHKNPLNYIYDYYRNTPLKYFTYLIIWIVVSGAIAVLMGYYSLTRYLYTIIFGLLLRGITIYIYPMIAFYQEKALEKILQTICIIFMFIYIIGIVEFIGAIFNVEIINNIINFISNTKEVILIETHSSLPRIRSTFSEPGHLASSIVCFLPLIYQICCSKFKIFKNPYLNAFIKKSLIPLSILCLLLTQSPIYVIIGTIVTIWYLIFVKKILKINILWLFVIILMLVLVVSLLCFALQSIDLSETFLIRIVNAIDSLKDWDKFQYLEPSLATRVASYITQIRIFIQYPLFGIGFGNRGYIAISFFQNSPFMLPYELQNNLILNNGNMSYNTNCIYQFLHQTGILGAILYIVLMLKNISILKKALKWFRGIEYDFVLGYINVIFVSFALSIIYNIGFMGPIFLFEIGFCCIIIKIANYRQNVFYSRND